MSFPTDNENPSPNVPEYSVSELSGAIKRTIEDAFGFVRVRGEIGRVSRPGSGHIYLDLKDEKAVLNGVIWKGQVSRLKIKPEQGLEVVCTGRLTTFGGQSRYQMVIETMEPAGVGALMALLEERRKKLTAEGLFAAERKQALPFLPEVIGVVTSPSGAVIRDILHRLRDRFPRRVLIWPTLVQGDKAAAQIAGAIDGFNALPKDGPIPRPDILIVARGGGSIEDLWAFNEEIVVRATANSKIPLISAVGHETDTTLIDFASDHRAPTPTAAAERAVPVRAELVASLGDFDARLTRSSGRLLEERRQRIASLARALPRPADLLGLAQQRYDGVSGRLSHALRANLDVHNLAYAKAASRLRPEAIRQMLGRFQLQVAETNTRNGQALRRRMTAQRDLLSHASKRLKPAGVLRSIKRNREILADLAERTDRSWAMIHLGAKKTLDTQAKLLDAFSYARTLERGFVLVHDEAGKLIRRKSDVQPGTKVEMEFADGRIAATTSMADIGQAAVRPQKAKKKSQSDTEDQGRLL